MNEIIEPEPGDPASPVIDHTPVPEPAEPPPPTVVPRREKRRGGAGGVFFSLLLFALLGAAGYYAWTNPSPEAAQQIEAAGQRAQAAETQAAQAQQQVAALTQQLQAFDDRIGKLEKAPPPQPAPAAPPDLGDLPKRVDDLTARVDALANRPEPARSDAQAPDSGAAPQALADLNQRVAALADAQRTDDALKAAVGQLGSRVDRLAEHLKEIEDGEGQYRGSALQSQRITRIEAALVALQAGKPLGKIPGAPPALARFATVAPPSEVQLREDFPGLAAQARQVSLPDLSGKSFWQRALTRLQTAVTVRQGDDVLVGDPAAGILSDAGDKVRNGDLAGAVAVMRALQGPAANVMQEWMADASALVAARAALADLAGHA